MTNQLKTDLVVMTGDYLILGHRGARGSGAGARGPSCALRRIRLPREPRGITETEESITRLFAAQGIHILRQERAPIQLQGETINLIGVDDSQSDIKRDRSHGDAGHRQHSIDSTMPVPADFDHAVKYGIDLMLTGHTHGGQLSLNSLSGASPFPAVHTLRQRMVRKISWPTLCQSWYRNHHPPHPLRRTAGDHGI